MSIRQAEEVVAHLRRLALRQNAAWKGPVQKSGAPPISLPGGMKITLLSPRAEDLHRLAEFSERSLKGARIERSEAAEVESDEGLTAASEKRADSSRRGRDAGTGPPDVDGLAAQPFVGDRSAANNASIAFLAEHHGKSVLVCGDASADVLAESIRELFAPKGGRRLRVDAFVVPRGGSARNLHRELLELIDCDRYLFGANGERYGRPDRETIARILAFGRIDRHVPLTLVFNYRTRLTTVWEDPQLQSRWNYRVIYPDHDAAGIRVQL